jgi:hypothetical protein
MKNLERAIELSKAPVTLDDFLEWDKLLTQSHGAEADEIGELYTTMMSNAEQGVHEQYVEHSLGQDK